MAARLSGKAAVAAWSALARRGVASAAEPAAQAAQAAPHPLVRDPAIAARLAALAERPVERSSDASASTPSELEASAELFRLHNSSMPLVGQAIKARVLDVSKSTVVVDVGFRVARLPRTEVRADSIVGRWNSASSARTADAAAAAAASTPRHPTDVRVGDVIAVTLEAVDTPEGEAQVRGLAARAASSGPALARAAAIWGELVAAHASGAPVLGRMLNRVAGGYAVGVGGLVAFVPAQQCSKPTARKIGVLRPYTVIGLDASRRNVVLADASLKEELEKALPRRGAADAAGPPSGAGEAARTAAPQGRRDDVADARRAAQALKAVLDEPSPAASS